MLVYMAGDNNLTGEMVWGLQEMRNTLELNDRVDENGGIDDYVGVIAQYDASGLNPCVLHLNRRRGSTGVDGRLDQAVEKELLSHEVFALVKKRIQPTADHFASAICEIHRDRVEPLRRFLQGPNGKTSAYQPQQANGFELTEAQAEGSSPGN